VSETYRAKLVTGKIVATPNPIPPGERSCVISWETNDPAGAEVRVSTQGDAEKLVSRGRSGSAEISWIEDLIEYQFRLYAASQREMLLDTAKVQRSAHQLQAKLSKLATEVTRGNIDVVELSRLIVDIMPTCLHSGKFQEIFPVWERHGFHVTPVHFYQPIPDTQSLPQTLWDRPSELVGIDMNDSVQLDLLQNRFPKFRSEYERFLTRPTGDSGRFYLNNGLFDGTDALVAYCMIRDFQPQLTIEVGSGFSSLILGEAAVKNKNSALICVEPFPRDFLRRGFPGLRSLIEKKVEDIDLEFFSQLGSGDILFIDSSHTVKIGGDVNYLFLEVLPRLKPGVIVHVHDIFFPFDYPRDWVMDEFLFWTEQYLLQAFLSFNSQFEVLMGNSYIAHHYMEDLKATFTNSPWWGGGSFWMRRRAAESRLNRS
jgi:Methyltransferase domain